jgi:hypothetical protein
VLDVMRILEELGQEQRLLVQSCEAYKKGVSINEYAKTHKELKEAIEFFSKNKTKIQRVQSLEKN